MATGKSYNRLWFTAAIVFVLAAVTLALYTIGWVSGEEFSPDDFSRRSFSYNQMPIFGISIYGIQYQDSTPVFEQTLLADGFVGPPRPIKSWHLISDVKSDTRSSDFDARLLCRFLDLKDENNESIWIGWNQKNPELAVDLWPIIAGLAQEYLYINVSRIMLKAIDIQTDDVDDFRAFLNDTASQAFLNQARQLQTSGKFKDAVKLYSQSIDVLPSKQAYNGRSTSYDLLGDSEKSEQDKLSARNLDAD